MKPIEYTPLERRPRRKSTVIKAVLNRDRFICQCCYFAAARPEVHHIHPLYLGGEDTENNAIVLCADCHRHVPKYPQEFLEYQRQGGYLGKIFFDQEVARAIRDLPHLSLQEFKDIYYAVRFAQFDQRWHDAVAWSKDPITNDQLARVEALLEGKNTVSTAEFEAAIRGDDPIEAEIFALSYDRSTSRHSTPPQCRRKRSKSVAEGAACSVLGRSLYFNRI